MVYVGIDVAKDKHDCFIVTKFCMMYSPYKTTLTVTKTCFFEYGGEIEHLGRS